MEEKQKAPETAGNGFEGFILAETAKMLWVRELQYTAFAEKREGRNERAFSR